jgi:2',3'-cyclic-nucleotide 2'-phosphodiesterase/3'-nucleotidase
MLASTTRDVRFFMMKWIEEQQTVMPEASGNWSVVPADWWAKAKEVDYEMLYEPVPPEADGPTITQ